MKGGGGVPGLDLGGDLILPMVLVKHITFWGAGVAHTHTHTHVGRTHLRERQPSTRALPPAHKMGKPESILPTPNEYR